MSNDKTSWTPIEVARVGNVGDVLQVSTGGGKSSPAVNPDTGMEITLSPPGQEMGS